MRLTISKLLLVLLVFLFVRQTVALEFSALQQRLFKDITDQQLDDFSHIEAAFILSGVTEEDTLQYYLQWYNDVVGRIEGFNLDQFDRVSSANKVFQYVRTTLYDEYKLDKTTLLDIVNERRYNCVSATLLYNCLCEELGWQTQAFETPTHVYTIFTDLGDDLIVENTHPMGFDIMQNLQEYSRYLASFYQDNQVYRIGLDRLYAHENSKGRVISNTELLGCLAYNQAYFAANRKEYDLAYELVLIAQDFNRDSRSNTNFEVNLYYRWGRKCFEENLFIEAFAVFADGYYRHPGNKDFAQNTKAAFYSAMAQLWQKRNWPESRRLLDEIGELKLLDEQANRKLQSLLQNWTAYLIRIDKSSEAKVAAAYYDKLQ